MGVDIRCFIKTHAQAADIAAAMSIFSGNSSSYRLGHNNKYEVFEGQGLYKFVFHLNNESHDPKRSVDTTQDDFTRPMVIFKHPLKDQNSQCMLFLEHNQAGNKYKYISPRSTPLWIAISKKLLDLFGGKLYYADSDSSHTDPPDYEVKKGLITNWHYEDEDDGYIARNKIMIKLRPITSQDLKEANRHAAYNMNETDDEWIELLTAVDFLNAKMDADKLSEKVTTVPEHKKFKL